MEFFVVITTINRPNECTKVLSSHIKGQGNILVVGDIQGPDQYELESCKFLDINTQRSLGLRLGLSLPTGCYSRKNIGYLVAIGQGASCIYETDDDNAPLSTWSIRSKVVKAKKVETTGSWFNIYSAFSRLRIWPRGFPLEYVLEPSSETQTSSERVNAPIQQGLANGSPDVDAVWRLTVGECVTFEKGESLLLAPGVWCPFNSQSTWWWTEAFPLLYLPSFCPFRMADIWRSFIAQRCLWELSIGLVFHAPEVIHTRNTHNLIQDFEGEIPGYLNNLTIAKTLSNLNLRPGIDEMGGNLHCCYERLVEKGIFPKDELRLVEAWLDDLADSLKT